MSTVLQRMIERTRAPLSSLEPLAGPSFAPLVQQWPGEGQAEAESVPDPITAVQGRPRGAAIIEPARVAAAVPPEDRPGPHPSASASRPEPDPAPERAAAAQPERAVTQRPAGARVSTSDRSPTETGEPTGVPATIAATAARIRPAPPTDSRQAPPPRSAPPRAPAAHDAADTGPTVTISIGHIEVRAAPASERSRPPVQPRVSLEEFLNPNRNGRR
jgi:hypothetical protein